MAEYKREVSVPGKSAQELYDRVSLDIDRFLSKGSLSGFSVERNAPQLQMVVKGPMTEAILSCHEGTIKLHAKLGFLAAPFKSKLDEGITRWLQKTFEVS